ncbi:DUF4998 domain-containing protein [Parapedobacter sp. 10938]|uniref:DUF4998 domain-containing protein n=1 Tax=Parapedobacter flavus TaxID=3110225 RepID=UPI002DBC8B68|nr:DUF4998 domain-containing protein [Parapedobacter sp. 10938]MEC3880443.1 DUF4998 domain-containing protein [Parapedobacter sp. 10938]
MKRLFKIAAVLSTLSAILLAGCEKMEDTYKQFIGGGETIYIGKADSVLVRGGYNRAEISWLLLADPKVDSYTLSWNNGQDSVVGQVTKTDQIDTVKVMLDNMVEGLHHFTIKMFDKHGNSSVPANVFGRVYGEQYQQTLLNRTYNGMLRLGKNDLEVSWTPAEETLAGVEVKYVNNKGKEETHIISKLLNTYVFPNFPANGTFSYRSFFFPDPVALDTFYTDFATATVDDSSMGGRNLTFSLEARYGTPPDQLTVWVSTDFDGVYAVENVEAATWREITDEFPFPTEERVVTPWGPLDLWGLMGDDDKQIYVAFKYVYNPDNASESSGINWRIQNWEVQTNGGGPVLNQEEAQFQIVNKGPLESGRITVNANLLLLRSNSSDKTSKATFWAISGPIE